MSQENVLLAGKAELYIQNLTSCNLESIGTKSWLDWHQRLQKLNQQAVLEAKEIREENIKEMLVSYKKIEVLVRDAICINVWKTKVLPQLLKIEPEPENTILLYTALYHEGICIALLETVLYHEDSCEALEDSAIDLLEYAFDAVTDLILLQKNQDDTNSYLTDFCRQKDDLTFDIGIRSISILRYLGENFEKLSLSVTSRMYSLDVPLLLSEILQNAPWTKKDSKNRTHKYIDGKWQIVSGESLLCLTKIEGQIWLCLRHLLLDQACMVHYEMTEYRKTQLTKLQKYMHETLLDQLPPLGELKYWLCQLEASAVPESSTKKPLCLEVIPQIKRTILFEGFKKWKSIARHQSGRFFMNDREDIQQLAQTLSEAFNTDFIEKMEESCETLCAKCGNTGVKKCSRCKNEYYCGRECQVHHWNEHKLICRSEDTSN